MSALDIKLSDVAAAILPCVRNIDPAISRKYYSDTELAKITTPYYGVKGTKDFVDVNFDKLVQAWRCEWSPLGGVNLNVNTITNHAGKVDAQICWLQQLDGLENWLRLSPGRKNTNNILGDYLLDGMLTKTYNQIFGAHGAGFWGIRDVDAIAAGEQNHWNFSNGLFTDIYHMVNELGFPQVPTGSLDNTNLLDAVDQMIESIPKLLKMIGKDIFLIMSEKMLCKYAKLYHQETGYQIELTTLDNPEGQSNNFTVFGKVGRGKQIKVCGICALNDDPINESTLIITSREFLYTAEDGRNDLINIDVQVDKRDVCWWLDFRIGAGVKCKLPGLFVINDNVPNPYNYDRKDNSTVPVNPFA